MISQSSKKMTRLSIVLLATVALCIVPPVPMLVRGQGQDLGQGVKVKLHKRANAIPNRYIVVLKDEAAGPRGEDSLASQVGNSLAATYGGNVEHVYTHVLNGYSVEMSEQEATTLSQDPRVEYVEEDGETSPTQINEETSPAATQSNVTWGLDRIDQPDRPLNNSYNYNATGAGVNVYVIDSGIRRTHQEFGGRVTPAFDAINDGRGTDDCHGHGTHVAGTIGGVTYGVAKNVRLYSVRVFGCNGGTVAGMIRGIDWVAANHTKPAVANLSGSAVDAVTRKGTTDPALDQAARGLIASGVTFVVSAMNDGTDASTVSPARVTEAITVGATDSGDNKAYFSNFGSVVDLFAPGVQIMSAGINSDADLRSMDGTSMAAPHVAGVAALYLQSNPGALPATVANALISAATPDRVSNPTGSPNRLLYSLFSSNNNNGGAPCTGCTAYSGSVPGSGYSSWQPNGSYYQSTSAGYHRGWLRGQAGADFDLYLYKWGWDWNSYRYAWIPVYWNTNTTSNEDVSYYDSVGGYYTWRVYSRSGSGSYNLWLQAPQ